MRLYRKKPLSLAIQKTFCFKNQPLVLPFDKEYQRLLPIHHAVGICVTEKSNTCTFMGINDE